MRIKITPGPDVSYVFCELKLDSLPAPEKGAFEPFQDSAVQYDVKVVFKIPNLDNSFICVNDVDSKLYIKNYWMLIIYSIIYWLQSIK